jgi:hypothetical protein
MKAPVYILEGTWWSNKETPLILSYFQALASSHREIDLSHRTIRCAEDIGYYVRRLGRNERAFLYFACHADGLTLKPGDGRSPVPRADLLNALREKKDGAIGFVHFGCCEMVDEYNRRRSLKEILDASGARWVSGYTQSIDWLRSTLLDLALVSEFYCQFPRGRAKGGPHLHTAATRFVESFDQLARELGFSGLSKSSNGETRLFPQRLR